MATDTNAKYDRFKKGVLLASTCKEAFARQLAGEDVQIPGYCELFEARFEADGDFSMRITVDEAALAMPGDL